MSGTPNVTLRTPIWGLYVIARLVLVMAFLLTKLEDHFNDKLGIGNVWENFGWMVLKKI